MRGSSEVWGFPEEMVTFWGGPVFRGSVLATRGLGVGAEHGPGAGVGPLLEQGPGRRRVRSGLGLVAFGQPRRPRPPAATPWGGHWGSPKTWGTPITPSLPSRTGARPSKRWDPWGPVPRPCGRLEGGTGGSAQPSFGVWQPLERWEPPKSRGTPTHLSCSWGTAPAPRAGGSGAPAAAPPSRGPSRGVPQALGGHPGFREGQRPQMPPQSFGHSPQTHPGSP